MSLTSTRQDFPEVKYDYDDSSWPVFKQTDEVNKPHENTLIIVRGWFQLPVITDDMKITLLTKSISDNQSICVNEKFIANDIKRNAPNQEYILNQGIVKEGKNNFTVIGDPIVKRQPFEVMNTDPGVVQIVTPAGTWKQKVFNGLAQIIVQSTQQPGELVLTASSPGLKSTRITLPTHRVELRPAIPAK
jgi:beta-galactosidase